MGRQFVDDAGQAWAFATPPRRIISLVPSLTELVCTLGLADRLVGVTRYCTEPAGVVAALPHLGGTKNPDVGAIVQLRPDLVLVNSEENRAEDFQSLSKANLATWVSFPRTVAEAARSVERLGAALGAGSRAAAIAADIDTALGERTAASRVRVFCPIWRNPWMSLNADSYAGDLLTAAGGENVCAGHAERYPTVDLEEIAAADPQVILLPDEPYRFTERHRAALGPLARSSASRDRRVHMIDGKALSWYGDRTAAALRRFRQLLTA
jgi:ABC-type Fe3+-hydroxamate transport system substrate-binding protein